MNSNYGVAARTEEVISAQRSRLHRQDGEIAALQLEAGDLERQVERIGSGLWQILAATVLAAASDPGEPTVLSRMQTALGMYELWTGVVDGDQHG